MRPNNCRSIRFCDAIFRSAIGVHPCGALQSFNLGMSPTVPLAPVIELREWSDSWRALLCFRCRRSPSLRSWRIGSGLYLTVVVSQNKPLR